MHKFVDTLAPLCPAVNDLGQCLPVAVPDTATFPGSDYYEIELGQYSQRMHADLTAAGTLLRGYRQVNVAAGNPANAFHYLGPVILASKNRPVRVKFINSLPTGAGGDLFIPTDTTYMGAGMGYTRPPSRTTRIPRTAPPFICTAATHPGSATVRRTSGLRPPARRLPPSRRASAWRMCRTCGTTRPEP